MPAGLRGSTEAAGYGHLAALATPASFISLLHLVCTFQIAFSFLFSVCLVFGVNIFTNETIFRGF